MATIDKISVNDSRIKREVIIANGKTYGYLSAVPENGFDRTIFLIHGFPDISFGWRYQIPLFLDFGYRVICPDCIGYGRSDAPIDSIMPYTFKSLADDIFEIAKKLGCENIIVGGHDWGAMVAYKTAFWHPEFVTHIFTACVPYTLPRLQWVEFETLTKVFPTLGYQAQFGSGLVEQKTQSEDGIRHFLTALYGGQTEGEYAMSALTGVDFKKAPYLSKPRLVNEEDMEYYVNEFSRNGLAGPCNFYRNRRQNFEDDLPFATGENKERAILKLPTLFLCATEDPIVRPDMTKGMAEAVSNLAVVEIEASHWILWQKPKEVNEVLSHWFEKQGLVLRNPGAFETD